MNYDKCKDLSEDSWCHEETNVFHCEIDVVFHIDVIDAWETSCSVHFLQVFHGQYWKNTPSPPGCRSWSNRHVHGQNSRSLSCCTVVSGLLGKDPSTHSFLHYLLSFYSLFPLLSPSCVPHSPPSTLFPLADFTYLFSICKMVASLIYILVSNSVKLLSPLVKCVISHFLCCYLILPHKKHFFLILLGWVDRFQHISWDFHNIFTLLNILIYFLRLTFSFLEFFFIQCAIACQSLFYMSQYFLLKFSHNGNTVFAQYFVRYYL